MYVHKLPKRITRLCNKNVIIRRRYCSHVCHNSNNIYDSVYYKNYIKLINDLCIVIDNTKMARECSYKLCKNTCIESWVHVEDIVKDHKEMIKPLSNVTSKQNEIVTKNADAWDVIT